MTTRRPAEDGTSSYTDVTGGITLSSVAGELKPSDGPATRCLQPLGRDSAPHRADQRGPSLLCHTRHIHHMMRYIG